MSNPKNPFENFRIITNPEYDRDVEPHENAFDYVNPVRLVNDLIDSTNAVLVVTEHTGGLYKQRAEAKLSRDKAKAVIADIERTLLVEFPLNAAEAKNATTTAAAIQTRVQGAAEEVIANYNQAETELTKAQQRLLKLEEAIDSAMLYIKAAERVADNLKTAIAWFKWEKEHGTA